MPDSAVPYYLKPKATKLAEGPDDSLEPPVAPTDAERRGIPPIFWAAMDKSKGGTAPQDAPLAPPATDSAKRTAPVLIWPRVLPEAVPNRPLQELVSPMPDLDPDIALWPITPIGRWPFAGSPSVGIWPKGWMGVDNTPAIWVCTVAGEPGTWRQVGAAGPAGGWPTNNGTGPGNLTAQTPGGDTVGYNMTDEGSGGINLATATSGIGITSGASSTAGITIEDQGSGGVNLTAAGSGEVAATSGTGITLTNNSPGTSGSNILDHGSTGIRIGATAAGVEIVGSTGIVLQGSAVTVDATTQPISSSVAAVLGDTGWVDASSLLQANWSVTASGICQYRKLHGTVYVEANITAGAGASNPPFTLPAGFRPGHTWTTTALDASGTGSLVEVSVATTGALTITVSGSFTTDFDIALVFPADA
jgi:hypothetical protein